MFPAFGAIVFGLAGAATAAFGKTRNNREREAALLSGLLGLLAFWASFGPNAGLYTVLFKIPMFSFLRAPVRLGRHRICCKWAEDVHA